MGLLEVVAEDLLELGLAVALGGSLVSPVGEPLVVGRPGPLEQARVRGVPDEDVVEPKAAPRRRCRRRRLPRARAACGRGRAGARSTSFADRLGRQPCTASVGKTRPMTEAGSMTARSSPSEPVEPCGEQRLDRRRARRDQLGPSSPSSGRRQTAERSAVDEHRDELLDEERVALRGVDDPPADVLGAARAAEQRLDDARRCPRRSGPQLDARRAVAFRPAHPALRSSSSWRAPVQSTRTARPRSCSSEVLERSRNVGSAQWMSSKTHDERPSPASSSRSRRAAQKISSTGSRSCESPIADARRAATSPSPTSAASLASASSGGSSSPIDAAWRTTSASGQNVMPSP